MRYTVTLNIEVQANCMEDARSKIQKLADTINAKDHRNRAWIPKITKEKDNDSDSMGKRQTG